MSIQAVEQAVAHQREAAELVRRAVIEAHAGGASVAGLARTADVTRQTIYRWIEPVSGG